MAKLYFHYSTMNAGKSTHLLQVAFNYRERGFAVQVVTAGIDTRTPGHVTSRTGLTAEAAVFDQESNMVELAGRIPKVSCLLVDEAQFLTHSQVDQLCVITDLLDLPVMCYGLRTDFRGQAFPGSARLLAVADTLVEVKTICSCGKKATQVVRVKGDSFVEHDGEQLEIGGNERYVSLCRRHARASRAAGTLLGSIK